MKKGEKYGKLVYLGRDYSKDSRYGLFKCDCGNTKSIITYNVKNGATRSCGCINKIDPPHTTYGYSHTRIDNIYKTMISRCGNPNNRTYKYYGARGICVCEEWKTDKIKFFEWAFANGYSDTLTLDRKDNYQGYSPDNCRWITYKGQNNNRRNNRLITAFGKTKTVAEWADERKIKAATIHARLKRGWSAEKALKQEEAW